jgi:hypothetical protein
MDMLFRGTESQERFGRAIARPSIEGAKQGARPMHAREIAYATRTVARLRWEQRGPATATPVVVHESACALPAIPAQPMSGAASREAASFARAHHQNRSRGNGPSPPLLRPTLRRSAKGRDSARFSAAFIEFFRLFDDDDLAAPRRGLPREGIAPGISTARVYGSGGGG